MPPSVSTRYMDPHKRNRWILRSIIACLVSIVLFAAYVPIQEHILRGRAEHLLFDIREIQLGKSNWADAQRLMSRWQAWGGSDESCTADQCIFRIAIQEGFPSHAYYHVGVGDRELPKPDCCKWMNVPYFWLGGRSDVVIGEILVRGGIIWGKRFELMLDVPEGKGNPKGFEYQLIARAASASRLPDHFGGILRHPDFEVGTPGACHGCKEVYSRFTPFADPSYMHEVMTDFNLSCLVRRIPCSSQEDVMPATWKRVEAERNQDRGEAIAQLEACDFPIEMLGRDSQNVAIANVVSSHWVNDEWFPEKRQSTIFHLTRQLKGNPSFGSRDQAEPGWPAPLYNSSQEDREKLLQHGNSFILTFDDPLAPNQMLQITECGIIPLNERNLAAVERGIQQDIVQPDSGMMWLR